MENRFNGQEAARFQIKKEGVAVIQQPDVQRRGDFAQVAKLADSSQDAGVAILTQSPELKKGSEAEPNSLPEKGLVFAVAVDGSGNRINPSENEPVL